jgi:glucose-1-phosphate adenylyltransferase
MVSVSGGALAPPPRKTPSAAASRQLDDRVRAVVHETLAIVLAGGTDTPLEALTRWPCRPPLPFGGQYRIIDFALSNCLHSGVGRIGVVAQYTADGHLRHFCNGWRRLWPELGEFLDFWPAHHRPNEYWYRGTTDALYQNIDAIRRLRPKHLLVLSGDQVCRMDYARLIADHCDRSADLTLGLPRAAARVGTGLRGAASRRAAPGEGLHRETVAGRALRGGSAGSAGGDGRLPV